MAMKTFMIMTLSLYIPLATSGEGNTSNAQKYMEVVNPNLEISKEVQDQLKEFKVKHVKQKKKKKLLDVTFRNRLTKEFKLEKIFEQKNYDELDMDNFYRRVENSNQDEIIKTYPFAKKINLDHLKNRISEYRGE